MHRNADQPDDDHLLLAACLQTAEALLVGYGWRLLTPDQLAAQALVYLRDGLATDPRRAAMHAYSHALHAACSGAEGIQRQELGYRELFHYLAGAARQRYRDVADDAVQHALERIFRRFAECRQPGTFVAFALQILRDGVASMRGSGARERTLDDGIAPGPPDWRAYDPLAQVLDDERRRRLATGAAELRQRYPRAARQLDALLLKYLDELDDETIAARLGTTIENVYVLRSRAIVRLQADPEWRSLAVDFGVTIVESADTTAGSVGEG